MSSPQTSGEVGCWGRDALWPLPLPLLRAFVLRMLTRVVHRFQAMNCHDVTALAAPFGTRQKRSEGADALPVALAAVVACVARVLC